MSLRRCVLYFSLLLLVANLSFCDDQPWDAAASKPVTKQVYETSVPRIFFLGAVRLFQKRISPLDGPRCSFTPTCSEFGRQSIVRYGPARGIMMACDRLQRCNSCAGAYYPVKNGRFFDPPEANVYGTRFYKE